MRVSLRSVLLCAAVLLPMAACAPTGGPAAVRMPEANPHADAKFLNQAPVDVLQGETFGKLAETKATDPALRSVAAVVVQDYGRVGQLLAPVLQQRRLAMPDEMDGLHQEVYHQMEGLAGAGFDRAYIERQMQDLTTTIELFQAEADSGKDPTLQAVARDGLPTLMDALRALEPMSHGR